MTDFLQKYYISSSLEELCKEDDFSFSIEKRHSHFSFSGKTEFFSYDIKNKDGKTASILEDNFKILSITKEFWIEEDGERANIFHNESIPKDSIGFTKGENLTFIGHTSIGYKACKINCELNGVTMCVVTGNLIESIVPMLKILKRVNSWEDFKEIIKDFKEGECESTR